MSVPNQKIVDVNKETCDAKHKYAKINIDAMQNAMLTLKPSELKLWLYFAKNQDGYQMELSSVAVQKSCGMSDKSYRDSIKALVEKRYLIQSIQRNKYDFYEIPKAVEMIADGTVIECHTSTLYE